MFDRYDIDRSGTLNSEKELKQLCTNLCIKLNLPITVDSIEELCSGVTNMDEENWELDKFVDWFTTTFLATLDLSGKPASLSKPAESKPAESPSTSAAPLEAPPPGTLYNHELETDAQYCWVMMFPQENHERFSKLPFSLQFTEDYKKECQEKREEIVLALLRAGLSLKYHITTAGDEYAVHIGAKPEFLQYVATMIRIPVKFRRKIQLDDGQVEVRDGYEPFDMTRKHEFQSVGLDSDSEEEDGMTASKDDNEKEHELIWRHHCKAANALFRTSLFQGN